MLFAHFVLESLVAHQLVKATFYNENGVSISDKSKITTTT